ncbi:MAG: hypothetical protein ACOZCP_09640 [Pseudomonadota bacterium]
MAHLTRNPTAGDTPQGIWQWWLTTTGDRAGLDTVEAALEQLVARGVMGVRLLASGERFYFGLGRGEQP